MRSRDCIKGLLLFLFLLLLIRLLIHWNTTCEWSQTVSIIHYTNDSQSFKSTNSDTYRVVHDGYASVLEQLASPDRDIILAVIDMSVVDMALNFYETSIKRLNITWYLFISTSNSTCFRLSKSGINCYVYRTGNGPLNNRQEVYGSRGFVVKMNARIAILLNTLSHGFSVIHTDVDMLFLSRPLVQIKRECGSDCDAAALWDTTGYNAGFIYAKNTPNSIKLYRTMQELVSGKDLDDQMALNNAASQLKHSLKVVKLDMRYFQCGRTYYEDGGRTYADISARSSDNMVVVHNNWIVTLEAKIYRYKEMLQWVYDGDDGYYSSTARKYLTYTNPAIPSASGWKAELQSLQNALAIGQILNRTVVLPKFHCDSKPCTLLSHIRIDIFDTYFANKYRENLFLSHRKVPSSVSRSRSKINCINAKSSSASGCDSFFNSSAADGATSSEILRWFSFFKENVLQFGFLDRAFKGFVNSLDESRFRNTCSKAFVQASYRQYRS